MKDCNKFKIDDIVYHRSVYEHKEPLKVKGIKENELLLEGDFSGGTNNVVQEDWFPISGVSRIYNHAYKEKVRKQAKIIATLDTQDNIYNEELKEMVDAVMNLTVDVYLNPEII